MCAHSRGFPRNLPIKNQFDHVALDYTSEILPGWTGPKTDSKLPREK